MPGDLNSMRCSFSLAGSSQVGQPGVPTSQECIRPVRDILVPPWGIPGPQLEAGVSHLHHIPQYAPVAQAQLLPPASLPPQLQPPLQPPQPLLQLPPVKSVMVDSVSRDLVWCSDPTAQSCRPSQDCLNFKGCPQSLPVVMQGQVSRPLEGLSHMVPQHFQQSAALSSFNYSNALPSVPLDLVNGPLESERSLRSGSERSPPCGPGSAMWIAGQERGSMCLPPSSGPLGLTGGQLEREFPALTQCALLPANRRLASGDMLTDPLKAWKNKKFDMKKKKKKIIHMI